jgi:YidC/Oxa1 family membrane protein insertase
MEKRTILALVLVALVIVITPRLFPGSRSIVPDTLPDTTTVSDPRSATTAPSNTAPTAPPLTNGSAQTTAVEATIESKSVEDSTSRFNFNNAGATLTSVELRKYRDLSRKNGQAVQIAAGATPLLSYKLVTNRDTLDLRKLTFASSPQDGSRVLTYRTLIRGSDITIRYDVRPESLLAHVSGTITSSDSLGGVRALLVELPQTLRSYEADTADDQRHLAFAYRTKAGDARSLPFGKLDPGEKELLSGPLTWVVVKSKYFLVGVLSNDKDPAIAEFSAVGGLRASKVATQATGSIVNTLTNGQFSFDVYTGPQQWRRLAALGRDFQNSNPYGGFLQPVVQPFATIVMKILLWMRENFRISYGWVLIIFGIAVRLILWPLNQKGMRASMKMQRIQPELNELQKRYKSDPQKLQTEMMRVYKEHNMSPFSTFAGCLPLFLPLPVLFALFFVFQNTIEFRGVPFLWFPDISQKDPIYLVPVTMGISMFGLSWIGMKNTPPNPQTKAMTYIFPVMMTVLFFNFPAGLNMYYTIQNLAALPQQWFIANERAKQVSPAKS